MKLVVGLGNPGKEYEKTNHNAGYLALSAVADSFGKKFSKKECDSLVSEFFVGGEKVILALPLTFMNNSGIAVKQLVNKYKVNAETELMVVSDDFDIKEGTIRIKAVSGNSTHNGIRSVKEHIKSPNFIRLKISIGEKQADMSVADFVLSKIKSESTYDAIKLGACAITDFINGESVQNLMQKYN